jgi:hypothetical protein
MLTVQTSNKLFFYLLLMIVGYQPVMAQLNYEYTEGKFMIKGVISDLQTDQRIPNANIWITNQKKGVAADADGKFTMYVYPTDTLRFSSVGYINKTIPVSAIPEGGKYTISIQLVQDIYSLKTVTIYPFHDRDEFIQAFIKGPGTKQNILISGIDPPKYNHKEKSKFYNPISSIYDRIKRGKQAADPNFKP